MFESVNINDLQTKFPTCIYHTLPASNYILAYLQHTNTMLGRKFQVWWDAVVLCAQSLILTSCCLCVDPPGKSRPLQLVSSWTVAANLFPSGSFLLSPPHAVFRSVWETRGFHSSSCKGSTNFLYSEIVNTRVQGSTFSRRRKNPTERLKISELLIQPKSCPADSVRHRHWLFQQRWSHLHHLSTAVFAGKCCVLSGAAVEAVLIKFLLMAAWGPTARGRKMPCLFHLPQVGNPSAEASFLQTPKKF